MKYYFVSDIKDPVIQDYSLFKSKKNALENTEFYSGEKCYLFEVELKLAAEIHCGVTLIPPKKRGKK